MHIPEENHSHSRDENPSHGRESTPFSLSVKLKRMVADLARNFARIGVVTATLASQPSSFASAIGHRPQQHQRLSQRPHQL